MCQTFQSIIVYLEKYISSLHLFYFYFYRFNITLFIPLFSYPFLYIFLFFPFFPFYSSFLFHPLILSSFHQSKINTTSFIRKSLFFLMPEKGI